MALQLRDVSTENLIKQKQKTYFPTLKPVVKEQLRSHVVHKLTCPRCRTYYVGQTSRYLITRFKEHKGQQNKPVGKHFDRCTVKSLQLSGIKILASTNRGIEHLLTLEALYIREIDPKLNTKDEYCSRELTIRF